MASNSLKLSYLTEGVKEAAHLSILSRMSGFAGRCFRTRWGGIYVFGAVFMVVSFLLRLALHLRVWKDLEFSLREWAGLYGIGFFFDGITWLYVITPMILVLIVLPDKLYNSALNRRISLALYFVTLYLMLLDVASEWLFWDEFNARFNFIAVDYLVYTQEVLGNIWQSYPVIWILGGIFILSLLLFYATRSVYRKTFQAMSTFSQRLRTGFLFLTAGMISLGSVTISWANLSSNQYANELAKNGFYSLLAAFRNNRIDYKQFYLHEKDSQAFSHFRAMAATENSRFVSEEKQNTTRKVTHPGPEKRYNVVLIVVESLSASFMKAFGNQADLTCNLDALAEESLFFTHFYATGTRTTRGLEAILLSLPPTPGQSLVKRPNNGNLFSLGSVLTSRGYDLKFIYGGRGFFDNMNVFFTGNHFAAVDQNDFVKEEISFTTAWGVCDEDLFGKTIRECDASFAEKTPFCFVVLTTSNHRPYTYPQKIDIPSGSGRFGAVKYCDYAIGNFIREAKEKPWFENTLFVIVADHCANSAGKVEVPVAKYHIPLLVYAPALLQPRRIEKLCSQIDLAPTLLGLMQISYLSQFYGKDILQDWEGRALLGNYQKIGLLQNNLFCLLLPNRKFCFYRIEEDGSQTLISEDHPDLLQDTMTYYQTAAYQIGHHLFTDNPL